MDSVSKGLALGGASAAEASGAIRQLTQALTSSVLHGEEFNSIMENGRGISNALSKALGVSVGELRKLARAILSSRQKQPDGNGQHSPGFIGREWIDTLNFRRY